MTAAEATALRIGEVARLVGTTTRTIRYYEEIGLLPGEGERVSGQHRLYEERDVERLREILRLKDLLGVSLDELSELVERQDARAALRREWHEGAGPARRKEILVEGVEHIDRQIELIRRRRAELDELDGELQARRRRLRARLREQQSEGR